MATTTAVVNAATSAQTSNNKAGSKATSNVMGKNEFLKILAAQLHKPGSDQPGQQYGVCCPARTIQFLWSNCKT
jgi:hypothetical protein